MKYLFSLLFIIFSHYTYSQTAIGGNEKGQTLIDLKDNFATYVGLQPKSKGLKGSPFLFEDMVGAQVVLKNGHVHEDVSININAENNELYVQVNPKSIVVPKNKQVEQVVLKSDQRTFEFHDIEDKSMLVEVIHSSPDIKVFRHEKKKLIKANVGGAYNTSSDYDEYENNLKYYILKSGETHEVSATNNGIKGLDKDKWKETRQVIKSESLDLKKSEDFLRVLEVVYPSFDKK